MARDKEARDLAAQAIDMAQRALSASGQAVKVSNNALDALAAQSGERVVSEQRYTDTSTDSHVHTHDEYLAQEQFGVSRRDLADALHLLRTVDTIAQGGGTVEIRGVKIERCDEHGITDSQRNSGGTVGNLTVTNDAKPCGHDLAIATYAAARHVASDGLPRLITIGGSRLRIARY